MTYPGVNTSLCPSIWDQHTGISIASNEGYYPTQSQIAETGMYFEQSDPWLNDGQDSDCVSLGEKAGYARRGPFRSIQDREETAQTRKLAACVRCRMQRIRVGSPIPCAALN